MISVLTHFNLPPHAHSVYAPNPLDTDQSIDFHHLPIRTRQPDNQPVHRTEKSISLFIIPPILSSFSGVRILIFFHLFFVIPSVVTNSYLFFFLLYFFYQRADFSSTLFFISTYFSVCFFNSLCLSFFLLLFLQFRFPPISYLSLYLSIYLIQIVSFFLSLFLSCTIS